MIEELREQKVVLDLQVEELQTRVHSLSSSLKQRDQEVEVSLRQGQIPSSHLTVASDSLWVSSLWVEDPPGGSIRLNICIIKMINFSINYCFIVFNKTIQASVFRKMENKYPPVWLAAVLLIRSLWLRPFSDDGYFGVFV